MARQYPRFLYSNPKNTKSKGTFVVHTMDPYFIVRVSKTPLHGEKLPTVTNGKYNLTFLELKKDRYDSDLQEATDTLFSWIESQEKIGEIEF